jgi:4-amino-4-deoxy-L-arabinose transferase-like glycosyltransferase
MLPPLLQRLNHRPGHYALLVAAGASLFLLNLGGPALWDIDEGRNATAAFEMRESGDWVRPTFNGKLRSHKPALLYWLQAAAYQVFGVNEFAARLPSALAALATVLLVYELGRRLFTPTTGLLAGLALASSVLFCASAHFANPDALLLTFTTATLLLAWVGISGGSRRWLAAAGVPMGLAVLAKGPVGIVLPVAVLCAFLLWSGRWRLLWDRGWGYALTLCALVALPWYVMVAVETKREFLTEFLLTHNLERATTAMEDHHGPPYYYLVVILAGLAPWSAFLGAPVWQAARAALRRRSAAAGVDATDAYRLLGCWIAVYFAAFTLAATKLPNYILPVFPAFALLLADFLDRWRRGAISVPAWLHAAGLAVMALIGVVAAAGMLIAGGAVELSLLHGKSWPGLEAWAAVGLVPLAGATVAGVCLWRQQRGAYVAALAGTAWCFVLPLAAGGSTALDAFRAPRPLVAEAGALQRGEDVRVGCFQLEFLPSLNFYVQRNVEHQEDEQQALAFLRQELPAYLFLPRADWERLAAQAPPTARVVGTHREMYRAGEVVVVTNH